jgi:hypothetical protein
MNVDKWEADKTIAVAQALVRRRTGRCTTAQLRRAHKRLQQLEVA